MFPYQRTGGSSDELDLREEQERADEERRLCYVAMTRAREQLYLSNVARRRLFGSERYGSPSRFLEDLPAELVVTRGLRVRSGPRTSPFETFDDGWPTPAQVNARRRTKRADRMAAIVQQPGWASSLPLGGRGSDDRAGEPPGDEPRVVLDGPIPPAADDLSDEEAMLRPGLRVRHVKYGVGKVQRVEEGLEPKAVVVFPGAGRKVILARFLQPA